MKKLFLPALIGIVVLGGIVFLVVSRIKPKQPEITVPITSTGNEETAETLIEIVDSEFADLLEESSEEEAGLIGSTADDPAGLTASESELGTDIEVTFPPEVTNTNLNTNTPSEQNVVRATILADDNHFSPAIVNAKKGDRVEITFNVSENDVGEYGLEIRSSVFISGVIQPGGSATVSFTANETLSFSSYSPNSGTKRADGQINIQ